MFGISSGDRAPAAAAASTGATQGGLWASGWRPAGNRARDPRKVRTATFATTLALSVLVALIGSVLVKSAADLHAAAVSSGAEPCGDSLCAIEPETEVQPTTTASLPREWRGHRKPYTFDHMYRK